MLISGRHFWLLVQLTFAVTTANVYAEKTRDVKENAALTEQNTGRVEAARADDLRRLQFLEEQIEYQAKIESVLADKLHATLDQLNSTVALLAQITHAEKRALDEQGQKKRDEGQTQENRVSTALSMLGLIFTMATILLAGLGLLEYKLLRDKLEEDLRAVGRRFLQEAKAKTAVPIYTRLAEAYSTTYRMLPRDNPLFNLHVKLSALFAKGTYNQAQTLKELWDEDQRKGRYKDKGEEKANIALHQIAQRNMVQAIAIQAFIEGKAESDGLREEVAELTRD